MKKHLQEFPQIDAVVIATANPHKKAKLTAIFNKYFSTIFFSDKPTEENGDSLIKNAEQKALEVSKEHINSLAVATDGGMHIPNLKNWNPVYTHRFLGTEQDITDDKRINALLSMAEAQKLTKRSMQWHEAIAIAYNGAIIFSAKVAGARGELQKTYHPQQYKAGIWVCSIWYFPKFNKNFFELNNAEREYAEISWAKIGNKVEAFMNSMHVTKKPEQIL